MVEMSNSTSHFGMILMAVTGHTLSQAKQKMHSDSRAGSAFFSEAGWPGVSTHAKTLPVTGHASKQPPSAMQRSKSTATQVP